MMATGTVLLVMTLDIMLITHPTSSSTGIFILTRLDCTVSRRELMLSITPFGKELSMSTSRTFTVLWDLSISLRVQVTCSLNCRFWSTFQIWLFSLTIQSVTPYSSNKNWQRVVTMSKTFLKSALVTGSLFSPMGVSSAMISSTLSRWLRRFLLACTFVVS